MEGFGAVGFLGALEPAGIKWIVEESEGIGGDGGFFFEAGGDAAADEKSGEQERHAEHRAAGVGGEIAGTRGIEGAREVGEEGKCPHGRIFRRGEGIEENGVGGCFAVGLREPGGEVGEVELPVHGAFAVGELNLFFSEELLHHGLAALEVIELGGVLQGEFKRAGRVIEAHDAEWAGEIAREAEEGESIGGGAEADVPNDEFTGVVLEAFADLELADVKEFGFLSWAEAGVHFLVVVCGVNGVGAVAERDEFELVRWHVGSVAR